MHTTRHLILQSPLRRTMEGSGLRIHRIWRLQTLTMHFWSIFGLVSKKIPTSGLEKRTNLHHSRSLKLNRASTFLVLSLERTSTGKRPRLPLQLKMQTMKESRHLHQRQRHQTEDKASQKSQMTGHKSAFLQRKGGSGRSLQATSRINPRLRV